MTPRNLFILGSKVKQEARKTSLCQRSTDACCIRQLCWLPAWVVVLLWVLASS